MSEAGLNIIGGTVVCVLSPFVHQPALLVAGAVFAVGALRLVYIVRRSSIDEEIDPLQAFGHLTRGWPRHGGTRSSRHEPRLPSSNNA